MFCEGSYVYKEGHPTLGHTYSMELMSFMKDTSLNPVPNAQVCVFDSTYYKITIINYISKTSSYMTFHMYPSGSWPLKILMFALLVTCEIATFS